VQDVMTGQDDDRGDNDRERRDGRQTNNGGRGGPARRGAPKGAHDRTGGTSGQRKPSGWSGRQDRKDDKRSGGERRGEGRQGSREGRDDDRREGRTGQPRGERRFQSGRPERTGGPVGGRSGGPRKDGTNKPGERRFNGPRKDRAEGGREGGRFGAPRDERSGERRFNGPRKDRAEGGREGGRFGAPRDERSGERRFNGPRKDRAEGGREGGRFGAPRDERSGERRFNGPRKDRAEGSANRGGSRPRADREGTGTRRPYGAPPERSTVRKVADNRERHRPETDDPILPDDVTGEELDEFARAELRTLPKDLAARVARHLVMAGRLVDEDSEAAYRHARAARRLASRVGVVREACGFAAYHAGEWSDALSELRAARRLAGQDAAYLPILADCERGLGRPERALDLARSAEAKRLDHAERIELRMVESGARRDLGQFDAAVVTLQIPELKDQRLRPWSARLFYAYADALVDAGREDEARDWFARAAAADRDGETDAAERHAELEGLEIIEADLVESGVAEPAVAKAESIETIDVEADATESGAEVVEAEVLEPQAAEPQGAEAEVVEAEVVEADVDDESIDDDRKETGLES
jgi:tetratricopeptide (TPR) repeat protein